MTKDQVKEILNTGYFDSEKDDRFEILVWTTYVTVFFALLIHLLLFQALNLGLQRVFIWFFAIPAAIVTVFYTYRADRKITTINTGLTEEENLKLLRRVFFILDWPIKESLHLIEITDESFFFRHWIRARFVYTDNTIGYTFQYRPTWRGGRPTFFFGLRRYLRNRFKNMLEAFVG